MPARRANPSSLIVSKRNIDIASLHCEKAETEDTQ